MIPKKAAASKKRLGKKPATARNAPRRRRAVRHKGETYMEERVPQSRYAG